jgi:hypothetical protein
VDDFTRYTWLYPLHNKSDTYATFVKFKTLVETQFNHKIQSLQSDGGREYTSIHFQNFLSQHGITHRKSCPHTSQQNGLAERKLRHILETGLTLLAHSRLSNKYWVDAFLTSVYIINRLPTPILNHCSPYAKLYGKDPNYYLLRVFGCKCFPLLRPYIANKLEYRSKVCIFLGYSYAGYRCLDPFTDRVYLSKHVIFDEKSFPAKDHAHLQLPTKVNAASDSPFTIPVSTTSSQSSLLLDSIFSTTEPVLEPLELTPLVSPSSPNHGTTLAHQSDPHSTVSHAPTSQPHTTSPSQTPTTLPHISLSNELVQTLPLVTPSAPTHSMTTISHTGSLKLPDYHLYYTSHHPLKSHLPISSIIEPTCYSKAAIDPRWKTATNQEYEALISNGTWTLCPRPLNHNVIRNKWVYKIKQHSDGTLDRFKSRLVAKGFEQQSGIDYTDTFSPVIKSSTIRIVLALAVTFNWPLKQLDVSNAFLHGSLMEEVCMEQPQGFINKDFPDYVCKLHKSIYGLKQASRAWFHCLSTTLLDLGFQASLVDTSLFIFIRNHIKVFLLIYVDDLIVIGTHQSVISSLITQLQTKFSIKDLGNLAFFLGIQVTRTEKSLHLCQAKYIKELLNRTRMIGAKPAPSPCPAGSKLSKLDGEPLPDPTEYRQVVGALLYCTLTRPDLAYAVSQLCQHMHAPSTTHWSAVKLVLRYLKHTLDHSLQYNPGTL